MRRFTKVWLLIGFAVLLNAAPVLAKDSPWEVSLPFETAVIHYKISGSQKGTETLYIRDSGNERVRISKSKGKILFVTTTTDTIEITTRDSVINIDMEKKTGTRMTNPQKFMKEEIEKLSAKERGIVMKNFEKIGMNMAVQMGGQVKPKAGEHLGYTCDLVSVMGNTSCQMSGTPIMLKMESSIMGIKINTVAKKIDKNATVPADVFQIPKGVNVKYDKEADDMSRAMIASMIESMKDPEAARKFEEGMAQGKTQMEEAQRQEAQKRQQQAEADPDEDAGKQRDEPDEEQLDEMMQKGMETLKGLFK
ncbi:MAG: hypothetical protein JRI64_00370 [Deltaproteobacteria bacterium]|nr:hypothetical protein [Deltaproteobacteria bacterium]